MKTANQIQELYTGMASTYERLFVDRLGWGRELGDFLRRGSYLHDHARVLDAGCGTGIITRLLYQLGREKGYRGVNFHAFDLTQSMLDIFRQWIDDYHAENIELQRADVLDIESLPSHWKDYSLIVTSTMIEYLPRDRVAQALSNLRKLLQEDGTLLAIVTRRNFLTRWIAGRWWKVNTYDEDEIQKHLKAAGFTRLERMQFTPRWSRFILAFQAQP